MRLRALSALDLVIHMACASMLYNSLPVVAELRVSQPPVDSIYNNREASHGATEPPGYGMSTTGILYVKLDSALRPSARAHDSIPKNQKHHTPHKFLISYSRRVLKKPSVVNTPGVSRPRRRRHLSRLARTLRECTAYPHSPPHSVLRVSATLSDSVARPLDNPPLFVLQ